MQQRSGNAPLVLHAMSLQRILTDYVQLTSNGSSSYQLAQQLRPAIVSLLNTVDQHSLPGSINERSLRARGPSQLQPATAIPVGPTAARAYSPAPWQQDQPQVDTGTAVFQYKLPANEPTLQPHSSRLSQRSTGNLPSKGTPARMPARHGVSLPQVLCRCRQLNHATCRVASDASHCFQTPFPGLAAMPPL